MTHKNRPSGWVLPNGDWHPCEPWEHIASVKTLPLLLNQKDSHWKLKQCWDLADDEPIRLCLARMGFIKVCYNLIDADEISSAQLKVLQELYLLHQPKEELEFIGGIRLVLELRLFLKLRSPERLNTLASMA